MQKVLRSWCVSVSVFIFLSHVVFIVPEHPPDVGRHEDVVVSWTVVVAGAGLDEHHLLGEDVSLWTAELHLGCDGAVGRAAAVVGAHAAELGFVEPGAGAA